MNITLPGDIYEKIMAQQPKGVYAADFGYKNGYQRALIDTMHLLIAAEDDLRDKMLEDLKLKFGDEGR